MQVKVTVFTNHTFEPIFGLSRQFDLASTLFITKANKLFKSSSK